MTSGSKKSVRGVYPGTFDPPTNGHLDIIGRALHVVDTLVVGVATNAGKNPLFSMEERLDLLRESIAGLGKDAVDRIEVRRFSGLLMHFVLNCDAALIVRGLRAVSDFEYEFQMTGMNARLEPAVETVFLMASERTQFISSRLVKEVCQLGGDIREFVPPVVAGKMIAVLDPKRVGAAE